MMMSRRKDEGCLKSGTWNYKWFIAQRVFSFGPRDEDIGLILDTVIQSNGTV